MDAAIDGVRRRNVEQREIGVERLGAPFTRNVGILEQGLDLGPEDDPARHRGVVERLDAEPVAREQEPPRVRVPDREGEHAAEAVDAVLAPLLVAVRDHLGVGVGPEAVAVRDQLAADLGEVVDLAVEDDLHRSVLVADRLVAGRQIDDAQPPVAEPDGAVEIVAAGIGPAVDHGVGHGDQSGAAHRVRRVEIEASCNSAHGSDTCGFGALGARKGAGGQAREIEILERRDHALECIALAHLRPRLFAERAPHRPDP